MGGYAAIIEGTVAEWALQPRPAKAGLLDRLLGRQPMHAPVEQGGFIELPAEELRPLAAAFGAFLRRTMPAPWEATRMFLEYLEIPTLEVHVRGARGADAQVSAWTLEFSFAGCAGMAEVSAELGAHWVDKWFEKEAARIQSELLDKAGFHAHPATPARPVFVPFEGLGYGLFTEGRFDFDYSMTEMLEQQGELESIEQLNAKFASLGAGGKCHCQLCHPAFTPCRIQS